MVELTGCSVVHKSETREASNAAGVQQSSALGIGVVGWDLRRVEREEGGDVSGAQYIRRDGGREVWSLCTSLPQSLLTDQCGWELGGREGNTHCDDTVRDWLAKRCLCDLFAGALQISHPTHPSPTPLIPPFPPPTLIPTPSLPRSTISYGSFFRSS